ncbi:MAG: 30S ribosomal protein S2 [Candidatus Phytoplasma australasiaticum]|nr:30S ribosomal protein S2 [Candidatus Phytoplasma australasiaticum]MDV3153455.1 30S ribosomal protein S2 [Candidatus Phytoplasma australasiaticum]MDV3167301.1 30S ribosomal protein S2 [Candidatus Phytoplasma australasiaticum]MDV3180658.1 30S ribosomal protein S2 [Candidatus Phytoplasma australasiaticum]MDV3183230.1 30S ribosomal protein S2 [Candidatus Phytoplasma australasiaticum]
MGNVTNIKQLLEAGIHFGHSAKKTHYKAKKYLFCLKNDGIPTVRNKIHIINLKKTVEHIEIAYKKIVEIVASGGKILFLGTKKQIQDIIKTEAQRSQQYYVNQRWLGGIFTNFSTITQRISYLLNLYKEEEEGLWDYLTKKEIAKLTKKRNKLEKILGGIKSMNKLPQAIVIIDTQKDAIAIAEARKLNITIFGIIDSNCDPDLVDYVIPANNDAIKGVKLITSILANAALEGIKLTNKTNESDKLIPNPTK